MQNDRPFVDFVQGVAESELAQDQLAALRRLFFESHTFALADVRSRVEASPDRESCRPRRGWLGRQLSKGD